jgi:hypothetical protein
MEILDMGADSRHGGLNKAIKGTENLGNRSPSRFQRNPDQGRTGMDTTEGIPLVMKHITNISSLNNLQVSVAHLNFMEIYQDKIPLGEG